MCASQVIVSVIIVGGTIDQGFPVLGVFMIGIYIQEDILEDNCGFSLVQYDSPAVVGCMRCISCCPGRFLHCIVLVPRWEHAEKKFFNFKSW